MSDEPVGGVAAPGAGAETYFISDQQAQVEYVQGRRAARWVPFLTPHLRPGMRLLDCGCGVGSITLDLAEMVAPGETVGIDMDTSPAGAGARRRVRAWLGKRALRRGQRL